jgi:hypothetical protein
MREEISNQKTEIRIQKSEYCSNKARKAMADSQQPRPHG